MSIDRLSKCSLGILLAAALFVSSHLVHAQTSADSEEQRHRAQREAEERQERQQAPDVHLPRQEPLVDAEALDLPTETPCFSIDTLRLDGERIETFGWAQPFLDRYAGRCMGREGIALIVKRLSSRLIAEGYVTTRAGIPEQQLSSRTLRVVLIPGSVRAVRFADDTPAGDWRSAFPVRPGDILNLRDIEQGLEQMKRLPSQDADIAITPGDTPGESDIVVTVKRTRPWRLGLSLDDSGAKATGKRQQSINLALDNLLGINDLLNASLGDDGQHDATHRGTRNHSLQYSIPWGYWTAYLSAGAYSYHQLVPGINQTFLSHGDSANQELKVERLVHRDQSAKTSLQFRLARRLTRSFIDDTEITVQRRGTVAAELAVVHRQYIGTAQADVTLARREGIPRFGGQGDGPDQAADGPTNRYRMYTLDATIADAFKLDQQTVRWNSALRGQATADRLYAADQIAIGGRYTVRGFDGEATLAAERGWYWRNELGFPLADTGQAFYAGIDHGRVGGPSAQALVGRRLVGAFIGLRGGLKGVTYDVFTGRAIDKPLQFSSAQPATGFLVSYQF